MLMEVPISATKIFRESNAPKIFTFLEKDTGLDVTEIPVRGGVTLNSSDTAMSWLY